MVSGRKRVSGGTAFYQHEPLKVRLKNLIHDYPEGVGIVKELIQNADDAGASRVKITFDWRTHPFERLPDDRMAALMGPAMLVYNDSVFSDADFENIQKLGLGGKKEILWKTGRFGIGFNSVYHVTDYPSFISRDRIVFFDPHALTIPETTIAEPGRSWQLADGWWDYPDFMKVYQPGGLESGVTSFNGTLFRLPLRTEAVARKSEIRRQAFTQANVTELLQELMESGEEILLFLKSVLDIQITEIQSDGTQQDLLTITTKNQKQVKLERQKLLSPLLSSKPETLLSLYQIDAKALATVAYLHTIETTHSTTCTTSTWRVSSVIRVDEGGELLKVLRDMTAQQEKAVPWAGAAALVSREGKEKQPFVGRAYCFLPLPEETGLPIHINGFFDLDASRRGLTSDDSLTGRDRSRVFWNQLLVRHVLAHACANLILNLVQDIGEKNPTEFYQFWPVGKMTNKVLEELPRSLIPLLLNQPVICATTDSPQPQLTQWVTPQVVRVLPTGWQSLTEPLRLDGVVLPQPELPNNILAAFTAAGYGLKIFEPAHLRQRLTLNKALGVPLSQAPKQCLRRKEWVINLLHYCLSDNCQNLQGLPLAILADGTLQTFGYNPPGYIYMAYQEAMQLFPHHPHWFLSPDLLSQKFIVPENKQINLLWMTPEEVAKRLSSIIDPQQTGKIQWQPKAATPPNAKWLAQVYLYFTEVRDLPIAELQKVAIVPGNDGLLHLGGQSATPRWCGPHIAPETGESLNYFTVPLVESSALQRAITKFCNHHPETLIWSLTIPALIDNLATKGTALPPYDERLYKALLSFLANHHWINNEGKQDQDRQHKLRQLQIYPTTDNYPVTLQNQDVYCPSGYIPPSVAGPLKLLCLGPTPESQEWKPLFDLLKVPILDHATLICQCLLPGYASFNAQQQLEALEWIRDHLSTAQTQLDKQSSSAELKKQIRSLPLIRCQDKVLRTAISIYTPESYKEVYQLIDNRANIPDMDFYATGRDRWLDFFRELRMRTTPSPEDLLARVDELIRQITKVNTDTDTQFLINIFYHIGANWEQLEIARIPDEQRTFVEAIRTRAWLPVEREKRKLKQFSSFKMPTASLYHADEVCFIQYGHLVASQKPLLPVREPKSEIQKALGFRFPDKLDVVNHFKVLIDLWEAGNTSNINPKDFQQSLDNIYRYFATTFLSSTAIEADRQWLRNQLAGWKCLWGDSQFWHPEDTFQEAVPFFGKRRITIQPPSPVREVYELLGQKRSPDIHDYQAFLKELTDAANGHSLNQEDAASSLEVLYRLAEQTAAFPQDLNILLLTEDLYLVPPQQVLIPDAPWRLQEVRNSSLIKLLHPEVPSSLAQHLNSPSLLNDIIEQPQRSVKTTDSAEPNSLCHRWQRTLKSVEFQEGLARLLLHKNNTTEPVNLDWLKQVQVVPAQEIVTDLYLNGQLIAADVPGDEYFNPQDCTFYLRYDDRIVDIMLHYLVDSLNNQLGDSKLGDKSALLRILNTEPANIERLLNNLRIKPLPRLTQVKSPVQEPIPAQVTPQRETDKATAAPVKRNLRQLFGFTLPRARPTPPSSSERPEVTTPQPNPPQNQLPTDGRPKSAPRITLQLQLPTTAFSTLGKAPDEFLQEMRLAAAVKWYELGTISQDKAAEIAGLSPLEFTHALNRYQV